MTRFLFFSLFTLLLSFPALGQGQWSISGTVTSDRAIPKTINLASFSFPGEDFQSIASIEVKADGRFKWKGKFNTPNIYELRIGQSKVKLAVDQAEDIQVSFSPKEEGWTAKIEGSTGTKMMYAFPSALQQLEADFFGEIKGEMELAMKNKDEAKLAEIQQQVGTLFPQFVAQLTVKVQAIGSSMAIYGVLDYIDPNKGLDIIEMATANLQANHPSLPVTRALVERLAKLKGIPIGAQAPALTGRSRSGADIDLAQFLGKYVYIDFWASWCLACRVENPSLVKLYKKFKPEKFEMLGVGIKDKLADWEHAIEKDQLPWPQLNDEDNSIAAAYFIMSLPQNVLLDPEGKIVARNLNTEELSTRLEAIFKHDR